METSAIALVKAATDCVVSSVWEGAALVLSVTLLLRPLRGMSATARFAVWSALSVVLIALPFFALGHGGYSADVPVAAHPALTLPISVAWIVLAAWTVMSLYRTWQLLRSGFHVLRISRESRPLQLNQRARFDLPMSTLDRVYVSRLMDVPCVVGFLRPRILLPEVLLELMNPAELAQIVQHEMEHVRRGDPWFNLAQKICLALFPLNPALWWAERRLCAERELACDDGVLAITAEPKEYALSLTNLAEYSLARRNISLMLGAWRRRSELSGRVHRILESTRSWGPASTIPAAAVLMVTIAAAGVGFSRCPSIVGFNAITPLMQNAPARINIAKNVAMNVAPASPRVVQPRHAEFKTHPVRIAKLHKVEPPPSAMSAPSLAEPDTSSEDVAFVIPAKTAQGVPHIQPVFLENARHAYAAFRLADGWLLIQL